VAPMCSDKEIAAMLGRSVNAVAAKRIALGYHRQRDADGGVPVIHDVVGETRRRGLILWKLTQGLKCAPISPGQDRASAT
jgi:hypothetical protein